MNEIEAAKEMFLISQDFKRFLNYCYIEDPSTEQIIKYSKWDYLMNLADIFQTKRQIIILKSKKVAVTTTTSMYALWKAIFRNTFRCLTISSGQKQSKLVIDMCKGTYNLLPDWMRDGLKVTAYSSEEFSFNNNSHIYALPSTQKSGLGETASLVIIDEWDFHDYPEDDYGTAKPTAAAGGQVIGISTSDKTKINSLFKQLYIQAKHGENNFYPIFLPATIRPDRTPEWFEREKRDYIGLENKYEENYPMTEDEALSPISVRSFFDKDVLKRLLDGCSKPIEERESGTKIYSYWRPGVTYVAGADESQGQGGDYQCLVVIGKQGITAEVCAVIHSNLIAPDVFAHATCQLLSEYKNPLLAGEANPIGIAYLQTLQQLNYPNLYYSDKDRIKVGIVTGEKNKELFLLDLAGALRTGELITKYEPMIKEMYNFQRNDKGKLEAMGGHDDTVMALSMAWQMAKQSPVVVSTKRKPTLVTRSVSGMYR